MSPIIKSLIKLIVGDPLSFLGILNWDLTLQSAQMAETHRKPKAISKTHSPSATWQTSEWYYLEFRRRFILRSTGSDHLSFQPCWLINTQCPFLPSAIQRVGRLKILIISKEIRLPPCIFYHSCPYCRASLLFSRELACFNVFLVMDVGTNMLMTNLLDTIHSNHA